MIHKTRTRGVILLSGNVHFAEISKVDTKAYPLLEFTSSGLTHINDAYARANNEYRRAGPFVERNFGLVEITWSSSPATQVLLRAIDADGSAGFTYRVSLDALQ